MPWKLAGQLLRVRLTSTRVSVFDGQQIVAEHPRRHGRKGQYSTLAEHVPPQHREVSGLWSRRWFTDRAAPFGPATVTVIEQVLDRHEIEEAGFPVPTATIAEIDHREVRGINPTRMRRSYANHDWRSEPTDLLVTSPTGGGRFVVLSVIDRVVRGGTDSGEVQAKFGRSSPHSLVTCLGDDVHQVMTEHAVDPSLPATDERRRRRCTRETAPARLNESLGRLGFL